MLSVLKPVAERAAELSTGGRLFFIDVNAFGITVTGRVAIVTRWEEQPVRMRSTAVLASWRQIEVQGVTVVAEALDEVLGFIEREGRQK